MDSPEAVIAKGRWLGKWVRFHNRETDALVIGQVEYVKETGYEIMPGKIVGTVLSTTAGMTMPEHVLEER